MPEPSGTPVAGDRAVGYEVTAVRYGSMRARRRDLFHRFESYGEPDAEVEMAYYFWVLRAGERTVLVDSGFDPDVGRRRGRTCLTPPLQALAALGVAAESVATVVVTHFHYDHIGNLAAFPRAELIVPQRELDFWTDPIARRMQFASHVEAREVDHIARAHSEGRVRTTAGEEEILPGVVAISAGGHSPGQQITKVRTTAGTAILTSDAVHFYEELELDRPFAVIAALAAMYRSYDRIGRICEEERAVVVPGHDPKVMQRFAPTDGAASLAVEIQVDAVADT